MSNTERPPKTLREMLTRVEETIHDRVVRRLLGNPFKSQQTGHWQQQGERLVIVLLALATLAVALAGVWEVLTASP